MNESKWAIRKIRKGGRVKIGGVWFHPSTQWEVYDGRLDGMTYSFGRYKAYGEADAINGYRPFIECHIPWPFDHENGKDPQVWEDGTIPWLFWEADSESVELYKPLILAASPDFDPSTIKGATHV